MRQTTQEIKDQFENEFHILTLRAQDQYRGKEPILTWLNEDKKPVVSLEFLLFVDRHVRFQIAMLLEKFSLQVMHYQNENN